MPAFDVVSEIDAHELRNAVDQANRELGQRFDFKGLDVGFVLEENLIKAHAPSEFQLEQMQDILRARLAARKIDLRAVEVGEISSNLAQARVEIKIKQGIEQAFAKKLIAQIKASKLKVEAQINGDKLRVSGKKRDDLQAVIALLRGSEQELPLQFENFRD